MLCQGLPDMEDTTIETDDRHMAFAPITAEDLILDPESLDIEVIDNDVLFADERLAVAPHAMPRAAKSSSVLRIMMLCH